MDFTDFMDTTAGWTRMDQMRLTIGSGISRPSAVESEKNDATESSRRGSECS